MTFNFNFCKSLGKKKQNSSDSMQWKAVSWSHDLVMSSGKASFHIKTRLLLWLLSALPSLTPALSPVSWSGTPLENGKGSDWLLASPVSTQRWSDLETDYMALKPPPPRWPFLSETFSPQIPHLRLPAKPALKYLYFSPFKIIFHLLYPNAWCFILCALLITLCIKYT